MLLQSCAEGSGNKTGLTLLFREEMCWGIQHEYRCEGSLDDPWTGFMWSNSSSRGAGNIWAGPCLQPLWIWGQNSPRSFCAPNPVWLTMLLGNPLNERLDKDGSSQKAVERWTALDHHNSKAAPQSSGFDHYLEAGLGRNKATGSEGWQAFTMREMFAHDYLIIVIALTSF